MFRIFVLTGKIILAFGPANDIASPCCQGQVHRVSLVVGVVRVTFAVGGDAVVAAAAADDTIAVGEHWGLAVLLVLGTQARQGALL